MPRLVHPMLASAPASWLMERGVLPRGFDPAQLNAEGIAAEQQRELLRLVAKIGGEAALLGLSRRLLGARDQPLVFLMLNCASVGEFIDKEHRFNRYFHTDHRIRVIRQSERAIELQHVGPQAPPDRCESLFVLGLHITVFAELGCAGLQVLLPKSATPARPLLDDELGVNAIPGGIADTWSITWRSFASRRQPLVGLDEWLVAQRPITDYTASRSIGELVAQLLDTDLARAWSVDEVARTLGKSRRTLQRELTECETSFSKVLDERRVAGAANLLGDSARSVTEIGYLCGFSDAAHFSRRFKAHTGKTPSQFRGERG